MIEPFFPEYLTPLFAKAADEIIAIIISKLAVYPDLEGLRQKLQGDSPEKTAIRRALRKTFLEFYKTHPDLAVPFFSPEFLLDPGVLSQISRLLTHDLTPDIQNLLNIWQAQLWFYPLFKAQEKIQEFVSTLQTALQAETDLIPYYDRQAFTYLYQIYANPLKPLISTGWALQSAPQQKLHPSTTLDTSQEYIFSVNLPPELDDANKTESAALPGEKPTEATLTVTLVGYKDSLIIDQQACSGEFTLLPGGLARITRQPLGGQALQPPTAQASQLANDQPNPEPNTQTPQASPEEPTTVPSEQPSVPANNQVSQAPVEKPSLLFPVKSPAKPGTYHMRCNIYYGQLLLQSYRISRRVQKPPKADKPTVFVDVDGPAPSIELDYHLSMPVTREKIAELNHAAPHMLSILLNDNDDGTFSFHFKGDQDGVEFKQDDVRFGEGELHNMIKQARAALHKTAWGSTLDWRKEFSFKYGDRQPYLNRLKDDLIELAKIGFDFYDKICRRLAGGAAAVHQFEAILKQTGAIQIALKSSPSYIIPTAMIYDYPLDVRLDAHYELCPDFTRALQEQHDLENEPCFKGDCPARDDLNVVCPGGFWGFRHYLGMPVSQKGGFDAPFVIPACEKPHLLMGEFTDFLYVKEHQAELSKLAVNFKSESRRDVLLGFLKNECNELVYFYCHGGLVRDAPFLVIGSKNERGEIRSSNLRAFQIRWENDPHPLVFLNGCRTSAVDPFQALDLIEGFIQYAQAAGLIGTEITIYEALAKDFAEAFFRRLLQGHTVGQSIHSARLAILAQGNPLGLVYVPFVQAGLYLSKTDPILERLLQAARQDNELSQIIAANPSSKTGANKSTDEAYLLRKLGGRLVDRGDYSKARPYFEKSLSICRSNPEHEHPDTAVSLYKLGYLHAKMGNYSAALPYYEQALEINRKVLGPSHRDTAISLNNLGVLSQRMGDIPAARLHFDQALAIFDTSQALGNSDAQTVRGNIKTLPKP